MITYEPLWETLKEKNITTYTLIYYYGFSSAKLHNMRHNGNISTVTVDDLCKILDCQIDEILKYVPEKND